MWKEKLLQVCLVSRSLYRRRQSSSRYLLFPMMAGSKTRTHSSTNQVFLKQVNEGPRCEIVFSAFTPVGCKINTSHQQMFTAQYVSPHFNENKMSNNSSVYEINKWKKISQITKQRLYLDYLETCTIVFSFSFDKVRGILNCQKTFKEGIGGFLQKWIFWNIFPSSSFSVFRSLLLCIRTCWNVCTRE